MSNTKNILHLARVPIYPPTNGREKRIWKTTKKLASFGKVTLATPNGSESVPDSSIEQINISNPLLKYKFSSIYLWNAALLIGPTNPFDLIQSRVTYQNLDLETSYDLIVCESPQVVKVGQLVSRTQEAPLLINKHNASHQILSGFLEQSIIPDRLTSRLVRNHRSYEQWTIDIADAVVFQSVNDRCLFECPDTTPALVIPNGTDIEDDVPRSSVRRFRRNLGIKQDHPICIFVGSYDYSPNLQAAKRIDEEIAPHLSETKFLLVGRNPPESKSENVVSVGFVEDLSTALALADVALCPLTEGSGTKLKMMDYLASGLPIVTTPTGASGINLNDGETVLIRESSSEFIDAIRYFNENQHVRDRLSQNALQLGESYSWDALLDDYNRLLADLLRLDNK